MNAEAHQAVRDQYIVDTAEKKESHPEAGTVRPETGSHQTHEEITGSLSSPPQEGNQDTPWNRVIGTNTGGLQQQGSLVRWQCPEVRCRGVLNRQELPYGEYLCQSYGRGKILTQVSAGQTNSPKRVTKVSLSEPTEDSSESDS